MTESLEEFGRKMTGKQIKDENLCVDLAFIVNEFAFPHGQKIVTELLKSYTITKKPIRAPTNRTVPAHAPEIETLAGESEL